ncbi:MAG: helix-turn-helix domain-containing protein [Geminicoccaceae bacterium]
MTAVQQDERSRPARAKIVKALDQVASYLSHERPDGYVVVIRRGKLDVRAIRERLGMSQPEFAARFGISVKTLRNWEQGHRQPEGPARAYLTVIKNDPEAVMNALDRDRPTVDFESL